MRLIKRLIQIVVVLLILLGVGGFFLPASTHVERNIVISAPADAIFPWLRDIERFNEWSPWVELDPNARYRLEGPASGVGGKLYWEGDISGSGSLEIVGVEENQQVRVHLTFDDGADARSFFQLSDEDNGTRVVWGFDTEHGANILHRYFGLFLDKWVGVEYEKGLGNLKALVESLAAEAAEVAEEAAAESGEESVEELSEETTEEPAEAASEAP